jgi:uncharacterized OB-fold protein
MLKNTTMKASGIVVAWNVLLQSVGNVINKVELGEPVSPTWRQNCKRNRKTKQRHDKTFHKFVS